MMDYTKKLTEVKTLEELTNFFQMVNDKMSDGDEVTFNAEMLNTVLDGINATTKAQFILAFCGSVDINREKAFANLVATPCYDVISVNLDEDSGLFVINTNTRIVKFADIEKAYRIFKSTENDKNGKAIPNANATVFSAKRIYGLTDAFIRWLLIANFTVDGKKTVNLTNVKIDGETIFTEKDGECFSSNSNNNLEKQLNIIVKFFGIDVKMLKKDISVLRIVAQRVKKDNKTAKSSVHEVKTLAMVDSIFSVMCSRVKNEDVAIVTNDKKDKAEK